MLVIDQPDYKAMTGTFITSISSEDNNNDISLNPFNKTNVPVVLQVDIDETLTPLISANVDFQGTKKFMVNINGHNLNTFASNVTGETKGVEPYFNTSDYYVNATAHTRSAPNGYLTKNVRTGGQFCLSVAESELCSVTP